MSPHRNLARALLFAVLLICVTVWLHRSLTAALDNQSQNTLDQRWVAMKGYLRLERISSPNGAAVRANWYFDNEDRDESATVGLIRTLYLVADKEGRPLEQSAAFHTVNGDSPADIRNRVKEAMLTGETSNPIWLSRRNAQGAPFLIRAGIVFSEAARNAPAREPYYVAIATPVAAQQHVLRNFEWTLAGVIFCALVLGWSIDRLLRKR